MPSIAIIADHDPAFQPHAAIDAALRHASVAASMHLKTDWVPTKRLATTDYVHQLVGYDGFLIAPGSPYKSLQGCINAIRFAREGGVPLLATCGGFQHVVIEFARNVLGFVDAQHAEYDPYASQLFISALTCSLAGRVLPIDLVPGSLARRIYGADHIEERYYCNFGLNAEHRPALESAGLAVTGVEAGDQESCGDARVMEYPKHPFFIATLFVPQVNSSNEQPHPLISAFIAAAQLK